MLKPSLEKGHYHETISTIEKLDTGILYALELTSSISILLLGKVEDIVPLIEFLASPQSQWVTAQTLFINGSYLAR